MRSSTKAYAAVPRPVGALARRRVRLERVDLPVPDRRVRAALGLIAFAVILFAVVVLFQLVTLPVEFDASRRAMANWATWARLQGGVGGARKVLTAAAMTYVAAALAALSQLAYYALIFLGNRG